MPNGQGNPHDKRVIRIRRASFEVALPEFRPEGAIRCQPEPIAHDLAGGECPDPVRSWVRTHFWPWRSVTRTLLKSCQKLPLCATPPSNPLWAKLRSETPEPIAHDLVGGECPDPFRFWVRTHFWPWRSVTRTVLKSCQKLPLCATQRSDPQSAKPRSETPEPIAHAVADGDCTDPFRDCVLNRFWSWRDAPCGRNRWTQTWDRPRVLSGSWRHAKTPKQSQSESISIVRARDDIAISVKGSKETLGPGFIGIVGGSSFILSPSSCQPHYRLAPKHAAQDTSKVELFLSTCLTFFRPGLCGAEGQHVRVSHPSGSEP